MSINELYDMTMRQVDNILRGRIKREEEQFLERWEMHRIEVVTMMGPYLKKGEKDKPYREIYPLPWEKETEKTKTRIKQQNVDVVSLWADVDQKFKK